MKAVKWRYETDSEDQTSRSVAVLSGPNVCRTKRGIGALALFAGSVLLAGCVSSSSRGVGAEFLQASTTRQMDGLARLIIARYNKAAPRDRSLPLPAYSLLTTFPLRGGQSITLILQSTSRDANGLPSIAGLKALEASVNAKGDVVPAYDINFASRGPIWEADVNGSGQAITAFSFPAQPFGKIVDQAREIAEVSAGSPPPHLEIPR